VLACRAVGLCEGWVLMLVLKNLNRESNRFHMNRPCLNVVAISITITSTRMSTSKKNTLDTCQPLPSAGSLLPLDARVVEWQTRTFEGRMPKGMRVQVPPRALSSGTPVSMRGQLELFVSFPFR
jgi:hypothetical protein